MASRSYKDSSVIEKEKNRFFLINHFVKEERNFLILLLLAFLLASFVYPYPAVAAWVGFLFAAYSAIGNDSIQTIGTFIASNGDKKWWVLWLFIGGIFLVTVFVSWYFYNGDVSFGRLSTRGFETAPESFSMLQVAAPIFLLLLTRLRMPVSTTFLLLSSFSATSGAISSVIAKSLTGYVIAFGAAIILWPIIIKIIQSTGKLKPKAHSAWIVVQWISSGSLWAVWIMQDAANIAVYLPRQLNTLEFLAFSSVIFLGLGVLFYLKGDKIQKVITEKTHVVDVRPATAIDFIYALILFVFQYVSTVPMSTTWVFIGLLGGRELSIQYMLRTRRKRMSRWRVLRMIGKDVLYAGTGLLVSILLAFVINQNIRSELLSWF